VPVKERLLLVVKAEGKPADVQLMGQTEVIVGYWTGDNFRPMTIDQHDLGSTVEPIYWARISPHLPKDVKLRHQRILDEDVRS
jgi:hypothetical protein